MPADIRTRVADGVTFHAKASGVEIPLTEDHIRAIGGILQGEIPGYGRELRQLFGKGILELGPPRPPSIGDLEALLPGMGAALLYLDPRTQLTVSLIGEGREEPMDASPVYTNFVPPSVAVALSGLAKRLHAAGAAMHRNEFTRSEPFRTGEWLRTIEAIYRRECERLPLSDYFRIASDPERGFRLEHTRPLQVDECPYPLAQIGIRHNGMPGAARIDVQVDSRSLAAIGKLFRKMRQGIDRASLAAAIAEPEIGTHLYNVLAALARGKCLAATRRTDPAPDGSLPGPELLSAFHIGHASLLIHGGQSSVLVDPWFLPGHSGYRQQPLDPGQLPPIEAILLTHEHWDHVNAESVLAYPMDVPVIVPRQIAESPLYPRYRQYLQLFGCDRVIELDHWETLNLADGLAVTAIPFRGEGTLEHAAPRNCYLIERGGKNIFIHVDSSQDSLGKSDLTDGTIDRLVAEHGPVDVVYATRRQELHFGFEIISDLYPILLGSDPRQFMQVRENCHCPASYLADLARATHCSRLVLYSEGGAEWFPRGTNFLRTDNGYAFHGEDHLWDTLEEIEAAVPALVHMSMPHDYVRLDQDGITFVEGPLRG